MDVVWRTIGCRKFGKGWQGSDGGGERESYKMFCNSLEDVDLFACICLSACLPEYL